MTSEFLWLDANDSKSRPVVFLPRKHGHLYDVEHHENGFYIVSNMSAENNKILLPEASLKAFLNVKFSETSENVLIEGLEVFKDFLVISERSNGLKKQSYTLLNLERSSIEFDEETYRLNMGANFEYNTNDLYYSYSSLTTPSSVFRYNMLSGEKSCGIRKSIGPFFFSKQL